MHSQWTMIQYNRSCFSQAVVRRSGKCTINNEGDQGDDDPRIDCAKVRRRRSRGLDRDQPDTGHGFPEGAGVDVLLSPAADSLVKAENPPMAADNYFRPVQYPGVQSGRGFRPPMASIW
jgi:hypothetical protein